MKSQTDRKRHELLEFVKACFRINISGLNLSKYTKMLRKRNFVS